MKEKKEGYSAIGVRKQTSLAEPPKAMLIEVRKLLMEQKSEKVIEKLMQIALDDEHSGQLAAIKMVVDRMLPVSEFEKVQGAGKANITINISGVTDNQTIVEGETIG